MKVISRIREKITADEDPKKKFENNLRYFLRTMQSKGILEVNGPIQNPRYLEIQENFGSFSAVVSIKSMLIDYQTIRSLYMYSGRFDIEVAAIQQIENRWTCLVLKGL